jgi:hypothetical protein
VASVGQAKKDEQAGLDGGLSQIDAEEKTSEKVRINNV